MGNKVIRDRFFLENVTISINSILKNTKDAAELKWSRLGVFEKVEKNGSALQEIIASKINPKQRQTTYSFEEVVTEDGLRLNPVRMETGLQYKPHPKKPKRRLDGVTLASSRLLITPHALERVAQRGGLRRVNACDFWDGTAYRWMNHLSKYGMRYGKGDPSKRKLWLVPFKKGAFLVSPYKSEDYGAEVQFRPKRRFDRSMRFLNESRYAFIACTYITSSQMYPEQDDVVKTIRSDDFNRASELIFQ